MTVRRKGRLSGRPFCFPGLAYPPLVPYTANAPIEAMFKAAPLERSAKRIADRSVDAVKKGAARRTPVAAVPRGLSRDQFSGMRGRTPGTAKRSWYRLPTERTTTPAGEARFGGDAASDDPQMPHIEWDTRPHVIKPRLDRPPASIRTTGKPRLPGTDPNARLRFWSGGRERFPREVHHPGTTGQHMMRDSLAEVGRTWAQKIGAEEVERWAREQSRVIP